MSRRAPCSILLATCTLGLAVALPLQAAAGKGYVVSLFVTAMYNVDDKDCPQGKNPNAAGLMGQILERQGVPRGQIQKLLDPDSYDASEHARMATFRGRIDGKPVDVYLNPLSSPETIKLLDTRNALGFNLDGKEGPGNFVDPFTGETGVDHQLARVFGCFDRTRGTPDVPAGNWVSQWRSGYAGMSWLIEIRGLDDLRNDDDVEVGIYRGLQAATVGGAGEVQRNMTYTIDADPRMQHNRFHGRVRDGMFVSDRPIDFFMIADLRLYGYFDFKRARLRLAFRPDGSVQGYIGGYLSIDAMYARYVQHRGQGEYNNAMSFPGVYQAMRRLADTDVDADANTSTRTRISATYQITGVPAFLLPASPQPTIPARLARAAAP